VTPLARTWGLVVRTGTLPLLQLRGAVKCTVTATLGFADPVTGVAVGYVANTMLNDMAGADPRWIGWTAALREAVGLLAALAESLRSSGISATTGAERLFSALSP